jgi:hypothetical protein
MTKRYEVTEEQLQNWIVDGCPLRWEDIKPNLELKEIPEGAVYLTRDEIDDLLSEVEFYEYEGYPRKDKDRAWERLDEILARRKPSVPSSPG